MHRQIRWARIIAEGAAIVVSILLAFWIEAWWDGRQVRAEEQELIRDLREEFVDNRELIAAAIRNHEGYLGFATELSAPSSAVEAFSPDCLATMAGYLTTWSTVHPASGALGAALASGRIGVLADGDLRARLAGWPRQVDELTENEDIIQEWVLTVYVPAVLGGVPALGAAAFSVVAGPAYAGTAEEFNQVLRFHSSPAGRGYASYRAFMETLAVRDANALLTELSEILHALQEGIDH